MAHDVQLASRCEMQQMRNSLIYNIFLMYKGVVMRNLLLSSMMCLMVMLGVSGNAQARDGHNGNRPGNNRPEMVHHDDHGGHLDGPGGPNRRRDNARHDTGRSRGYSNDRNYCSAMSSSSFNSLLSALKNAASFDRMNILNSAISQNYFSSQQVAQVIGVMGFKSYEEDAAAAMYSSVCDKENWFSVYEAFTFSSSVGEVNSRIVINSSSSSDEYGICRAMSSGSFNTLLSTLNKAASFDKLDIVQTAAKTNNFTVSQVAQIIDKMGFKSYEEDAAVMLYSSVCDTNNWFMLANAFTFSNSFSEVSKRI